MENNRPLLSICIPTWNRSKFLSKSLESFISHIKEIDLTELELYVSDNCSDDDTPNVVELYKTQGLPITYNRNSENIGAAGNFLKCMNWASGKYILLLGDDDILKPGSLKLILDSIRGKEYGLIHIHPFSELKGRSIEYNNCEDFFKQISYLITFMSGSIFRKDIVTCIDPSKYEKTHLLQVPYYISSALSIDCNLIIGQDILESGLDDASNGGYNFYEVFVKHYLDIWMEFVDDNKITRSTFEYLKKDIYKNFIIYFNYTLLLCHKNVKDEKISNIGNRNGFKIAKAKEILKKYYGANLYSVFYKYKYIRFFINDLFNR